MTKRQQWLEMRERAYRDMFKHFFKTELIAGKMSHKELGVEAIKTMKILMAAWEDQFPEPGLDSDQTTPQAPELGEFDE